MSWGYFHVWIYYRNSANKGQGIIWSQSLRAAAYCRACTDHEAQKQSVENQIAFCADHVSRNPYWKLTAVYADSSSGLHIKSRPGCTGNHHYDQEIEIIGDRSLCGTGWNQHVNDMGQHHCHVCCIWPGGRPGT